MPFSNYIVYVDESGDHGLKSINPQNPVFVLALCIFEKSSYRQAVVPVVQELKFDYWGHDAVILHSHDIRNQRGDFKIFNDQALRAVFLDRLNTIVDTMPVTVIAAVIDKYQLVKKYADPSDPYSIALAFCMERLQMFLRRAWSDSGQNAFACRVPGRERGQRPGACVPANLRWEQLCWCDTQPRHTLHGQKAQFNGAADRGSCCLSNCSAHDKSSPTKSSIRRR